MVRDDALVDLWGRAIQQLSSGKEEEWKASFREAMERSADDLTDCGRNAKLRLLGRQLGSWWESHWAQGDDAALALLESNKAANKAQLWKQVMAMRFNWETGYSFDAGRRLGNYWKLLIGETQWFDQDEFYFFVQPAAAQDE